MFDTRKFGGYLSRLRKSRDMTQSDLADRLNLTRQAVSRYELGISFPDVSILSQIADVFGIGIDELINSCEPTKGESLILKSIASGEGELKADNIRDVISLAPILKPSVLAKLSAGFKNRGLDISNIIALAEYLCDESTVALLKDVNFESASDELIEKLMPWLDVNTKYTIFNKILNGEMDWHLLRVLMPYANMPESQVEAAVLEGALPWEALDVVREALSIKSRKNENSPW